MLMMACIGLEGSFFFWWTWDCRCSECWILLHPTPFPLSQFKVSTNIGAKGNLTSAHSTAQTSGKLTRSSWCSVSRHWERVRAEQRWRLPPAGLTVGWDSSWPQLQELSIKTFSPDAVQRKEALKKTVKALLSIEGHYKDALLCQKSLQLKALDPDLGLLQAQLWQGMLWTPYHLNSVLISLSSLAVWLLYTLFCVCTSCSMTKLKNIYAYINKYYPKM